jgi:hypothetical protein
MRYLETSNILALCIFALFPVLSGVAIGQSVCEAGPIKLDKMDGVIRATDDLGKGALSEFDVKLWKARQTRKKPVASTKSGVNGHFRFPDVSNGDYRIEVVDPKGVFIRIFANLQLYRRKIKPSSEMILLVTMGVAPLEPCGGGEARSLARRSMLDVDSD